MVLQYLLQVQEMLVLVVQVVAQVVLKQWVQEILHRYLHHKVITVVKEIMLQVVAVVAEPVPEVAKVQILQEQLAVLVV